MSYTFRPAVRENTPLIIGIAGPTKSGKTMSALRVATGLANGGTIAMINAEGLRGHQYADKFKYVTCDLLPPFRPSSYTDALKAAASLKPAVVIIDSVSHMHDGPGGVLEWHEEILDRMAGADRGKRDKCTFTAWVEPKASENQFIYEMLGMKCPVILCLRAKEKIKIVAGKPPLDLGWQPIVGERVAFETIFTLMLVPHCKGVPDLSLSDMREPFDTLIPKTEALNEQTGRKLAEWSTGGQAKPAAASVAFKAPEPQPATTLVKSVQWVVPFGKMKGQPISGVSDEDVEYLNRYYNGKLSDPANATSRYRDEWENAVLEIRAEQLSRTGAMA